MPKQQPMQLNQQKDLHEQMTGKPEFDILSLLETQGLSKRQQREQREEFKNRLFDLATHYMDQSIKVLKRWIKEDTPETKKNGSR